MNQIHICYILWRTCIRCKKITEYRKNLAKVHKVGEIFPVINISPSIMDTFGELKLKTQNFGSVVDDFALLTVSTAMTNNLILVTKNEKHFGKVEGLEIVNWSK